MPRRVRSQLVHRCKDGGEISCQKISCHEGVWPPSLTHQGDFTEHAVFPMRAARVAKAMSPALQTSHAPRHQIKLAQHDNAGQLSAMETDVSMHVG